MAERRVDIAQRVCRAERDALESGLREIVNYLHTSKFAPPNRYVNVEDILLRIHETRAAALQQSSGISWPELPL